MFGSRTGGVSIHSLRKKGDIFPNNRRQNQKRFNPLPSQEGRHTLSSTSEKPVACFNPLPSQEGRPCPDPCNTIRVMFQSTPFARRETIKRPPITPQRSVSIHSLRKKGDLHQHNSEQLPRRFNPLPSQEGRQLLSMHWMVMRMFQSTPFARRETQSQLHKTKEHTCFNPLPSQEGRLSMQG